MNEKVVEILKNSKKALNIFELQDGLKITNVEDIKQLQKVLK